MGLGKIIKKATVGTAKIAGSAVLGAVGAASTIVEYLGAGSNIEILEEMGHGLKSASFNGVRKMWGSESKEYDHSAGDAGRRKAGEIQKERERIISQREIEIARAEQKGVDPQKVQIAKEKIATVKGFSQSGASSNDPSDAKKDLKDIYISSPKVPAQKGTTRVAFVFSCPGQKEQMANQVCYGATGESLQHLITYCHAKRPDIFVSPSKRDYTITNASDRVHYAALTHDTEASKEEIDLSENLDRLRADLADVDLVICMGDRAWHAVHNAGVSAKTVKGEHLSAMHLNRVYSSTAETSSARRVDRITQVADKILDQL